MRQKVFAIYDTQAACFLRPFFTQQDGQAVRMFGDLVSDLDHPVGQHPEDYSLYRIGTFDDSNAMLDGENPQRIAAGIELSAKQKVISLEERVTKDA